MCALIYRHRPAYPALMIALCVLVIGGLVGFDAHARYDDGEGSEGALLCAVYVTLGAVLICVVGAFARYQFRHLWKNPDPAFSRKARKKRAKGVF
jgi:hypothetical protein